MGLDDLIARLDKKDAKVLGVLRDGFDDYCDGGFFNFDAIARRTRMNRRDVRLSCRRLKRKGLARFAIGLWNDDGEPAGAGYGLTPETYAALRARTAQESQ